MTMKSPTLASPSTKGHHAGWLFGSRRGLGDAGEPTTGLAGAGTVVGTGEGETALGLLTGDAAAAGTGEGGVGDRMSTPISWR